MVDRHGADNLPLGLDNPGIAGTDNLLQRLLEMGLLEGEEIEVLNIAPLGDPVEIRIRDYRLSLRRNEAARVSVSIDGKS